MSNPVEVEAAATPKQKIPKIAKSLNIPKINIVATGSPLVDVAAPTHELAKYQKMSDKEHILKKPDTYIGSIEMTEAETFVYDSATSSIVQRPIHYIPGLYKLFDEGAVNSRDHYVRQEQAIRDAKPDALPVTCIEFEISDDGTISITNDGNGIDVAQHPEHKLWIPEMIFGHLRTSTNYDENKKEKIVGGKNGFGFKLVLIWSSWGRVETVDHVRGLKYIQEFKNNLDEICPPKITKCTTTKPYTKVSFRPDYARFGVEGLTPDMRALFEKRIYDIAAITDKSVKVKYNGALVPVKHFQQYIDLYIGAKSDTKRIYEAPDPRWEYVVSLAPNGEFQHVSFVNGIYTQKGGKHVEYIINQIVRKLTEYIKNKKKVDVKPTTIKEQLAIFLRCDIDNPSFSSQSKDEMGTAVASFGSTCKVSDDFVEKLAKMGVMDAACALTEVKENKAAKKTDGTKTRTIRGIPKLIDANYAGTEKSAQCTIIFCKGDSAKAGIVSGLSREDRNTIGVYPMKGKMMNTRGEPVKKIAENNEIKEIKQILGLEVGRKYTPDDVKYRLRYGKVLFMTDQDLDGSHIKGLGINLFQNEWATLTEIPGFIGFMNTPILKAKKGAQEKVFYSEGEYRAWKETSEGGAGGGGGAGVSTATHMQPSGWTTKYYKGLGTSTGKEFKEYFEHKKIVDFTHSGEACDDAIDMVFNKKRADDRKTWLATYSRDRYLDTLQPSVTYEKFINDEMIHFSKYDCDRSIPNLMDGLKISLRKILFSAFKKNLKNEIKVAQFSGYVSEHSGYHHGEASLNAAIVGMAQNFVGSNNINLFEPNGQFGTRLQGGQDSASERYIFTQLNKLTRLVYRPEDDAILTYLDDDGQSVEPIYYVPIIPMVLVNGTKGIGTGFSTEVMCYNPAQIIAYIKHKLIAESSATTLTPSIEPFYKNFKGTIRRVSDTRYLFKGCYTILDDKKIRITELPIGTWTDNYKKFLENLIEPQAGSKDKDGPANSAPIVKDYNDMSTDTHVDITVTMAANIIKTYSEKATEFECNMLEKVLGLYTTQSTTNMNLFDAKEKLIKYGSAEEIVDSYSVTRLEFYVKRKDALMAALRKELMVLSNRARYITELLEDKIDLRRKTNKQLVELLKERKYDSMDTGKDAKDRGSDENGGDERSGQQGYKYLLKLPMDSVSEENVHKLLNEKEKKDKELSELNSKTVEEMWLKDLEELEVEYNKFIEATTYSAISTITSTSKAGGGGASKVKKLKSK
uniref:DNA topoisomerase (ATP-hydrolyzing) n=1 Tax=viral metagenome TaxID=1070528 RepID=A0A6C0EWL4_9ZZZZ